MPWISRASVILASLAVLCLSITHSHAEQTSANALSQIGPGVYVSQGHDAVVFEGENIANIGFIVGDRCIAVIDTGGSYAEGMRLQDAIRRVSDLPICYVINTHGHPDHILGNLAFKAEHTQFVGHEKLPRGLSLAGETYLKRASEEAGHEITAENIVLPDVLVQDEMIVDLGGRSLVIHAQPPAHSNADLTILDMATGTLWLSDLLFIQHVPVITGSLNGWLQVMEDLAKLSVERVVPGHGPVQAAWPEAAEDMLQYLSTIRRETREWLSAGGDLQGAEEEIGYDEAERWDLFEDYHRRNIIAAYTELEWE